MTTPLEEDTGTQPHLGFSMDSSAWDGAGTVQGAKEWGQGGPALPPRAPCLSVRGEGHSDAETSEQTHTANPPVTPTCVGAGKASLRRGCLSQKPKDQRKSTISEIPKLKNYKRR